MGMLCMLFMDICPDLQMNNSRDVSFHLKLSDNTSVHQFSCWNTDCFCKKPRQKSHQGTRSYYNGGKLEIKRRTGKESLAKDKKDTEHIEY